MWLSCARIWPPIGRWQPAVSEQRPRSAIPTPSKISCVSNKPARKHSLFSRADMQEKLKIFSFLLFPSGLPSAAHGSTHDAHLHSLIPVSCLFGLCLHWRFRLGIAPEALGIGCTRTRSHSVSYSAALALHVTQPKCAHITRLHIRSMG